MMATMMATMICPKFVDYHNFWWIFWFVLLVGGNVAVKAAQVQTQPAVQW